MFGPLVLLTACLAQTFLFDRWNGDPRRLDAAEVVWDVYRSNHYALNALRADQNFAKLSLQDENIIRWQTRNLNVASERIKSAVESSTFEQMAAEIESTPMNRSRLSSGVPDGRMAVSIELFKAIFIYERERIVQKKELAQYLFWVLYGLGSAITIASTVLKERLTRDA